MKTEKQVTFLPGRRLLRKSMVPSYFSTIPLQIQRPKPGSFCRFGGKKWFKEISSRHSGLMPEPVSRMETRTPAASVACAIRLLMCTRKRPPSRHCLIAFANEIEEYLLQFHREPLHDLAAAVTPFDHYSAGLQLTGLKLQVSSRSPEGRQQSLLRIHDRSLKSAW